MALPLKELGDLSNLLKNGQGPQEIELELIDEDPDQPRKIFNQQALEDLAASIKERGVKTPISLRPSSVEDRFIINHGARRYRASKLVGNKKIPAYIDTDYIPADQLIENIQRDDLTPMEVADAISKMLHQGMKKKEIAVAIGKSAAYVSQHATLLDLPERIAELYSSGRCQDVTVINELVTVHKSNPEDTLEWIEDENQDINRTTIKLLREYISSKNVDDHSTSKKQSQSQSEDDSKLLKTETGESTEDWKVSPAAKGTNKNAKEVEPEKLKKAIVQISIYGRPAQLILTKRPTAYGNAWMKYEDDGEEFEGTLEQIKVTAIIEG